MNLYKLTYFEATNITGFYSGMGKKHVEIDLRDFREKEIWVVVGDNGVGKSTFLSMIHPWPYPTDGRTKFVRSGKEGIIVREYTGGDGTIIRTKCVYSPKKDGTHNGKYYFALKRPGEKEENELNPNGNLSSYQSLLYDYFGINKDFLSFASYSAAASNIVSMTDTERKNSVDSLIPNVKRYEVAYNIVNDKYKSLNNMIKNLSSKITMLRDEDSLRADLARVNAELTRYFKEREDAVRQVGKIEGRLKELTHGTDVNKLMEQYHRQTLSISSYGVTLRNLHRTILGLYDKLDIEPEDKDDVLSYPDLHKIPSRVLKYEKMIATARANTTSYQMRMDETRKQLNATEKDINETESLLYSIQAQSVDSLVETKKTYLKQLDDLPYTHHREEYQDKSYEEASSFLHTVSMVDRMIQNLYEVYGELLSRYFSGSMETDGNLTRLNDQLVEQHQALCIQLDLLQDSLNGLQRYQYLQQILDKRPPECKIDSCIFIAEALKAQGKIEEIEKIRKEQVATQEKLDQVEKQLQDITHQASLQNDVKQLLSIIQSQFPLFQKYLSISNVEQLYRGIATGTWDQLLNVIHLKEQIAILSGKSYYQTIVNQKLPEIENAIKMAEVYGTNRTLLSHQRDRLLATRDELKEKLSECKFHIKATEKQIEHYQSTLELWKKLSDAIDQYTTALEQSRAATKEVEEQKDRIEKIDELVRKGKEESEKVTELSELINARTPYRERIAMEINTVVQLSDEKDVVERDFTIMHIIRSIVSPGKGVRRLLTDIYMYDICNIANQLLLNTFDGKLYLKDFIITDKEFTIPYVFNGSEGSDISFASSSQQATIASAISLAILSKLVDKYGIYTTDEQDGPLAPKNKGAFIRILTEQMQHVGIEQAFIITQEPSYYEPYGAGIIAFPGAELSSKDLDIIRV